MKRVFIDGSAGTTGLRIRERLAARKDLEVVTLADDVRKDPAARRVALNAADVAFLCLPDAAAVEAVQMVENPQTVVIDTPSTRRTSASDRTDATRGKQEIRRDDHLKNFSFLMDADGRWSLAPFYDFTWSEGPDDEVKANRTLDDYVKAFRQK